MNKYGYLYVAIGGALGAISRYGINILFTEPFLLIGTFIVNILGCFLLGYIYQLAQIRKNSDVIWSFWGTGFCGGFTTMSTLSMEVVFLWLEGNVVLLCIYLFMTLLIGIGATFLGSYLYPLTKGRKEGVAE
jgi:CrcB protein